MSEKHGIYVEENVTSLLAPLLADGAVQVVIGTAPINELEKAYVNVPVPVYSFAEAKSKLGYSDDFISYSLCEAMDASFRVFNVAPLVLINILDPEKHKQEKVDVTVPIKAGKGVIGERGILLKTLKVQNDLEWYVIGEDYEAQFADNGSVEVEVLAGGAIVSDLEELTVTYSVIDPTQVVESDVLSAIEKIKEVYPRLGIIPGQLLAPGWTHLPAIGMALLAKTVKLNGCFNAIALLDVDTEAVKEYTEVGKWKEDHYVDKNGIVLWPMGQIGEKSYHLSTLAAARLAQTDADNGNIPFVSPSNKHLKITGTILADKTEVFLDQEQGNLLNSQGVVTAINIGGWRLWGNNTCIYPTNTDIKDRFIPVRRMFNWWGNTFILTYFQKVDDPMNKRLIEAVVDSENIRANGFKARSQIAEAQIEYREEYNPTTELLTGNIVFMQKFTPFPPVQSITNVLEFDPKALQKSLS